jgi:hypothetical protein
MRFRDLPGLAAEAVDDLGEALVAAAQPRSAEIARIDQLSLGAEERIHGKVLWKYDINIK